MKGSVMQRRVSMILPLAVMAITAAEAGATKAEPAPTPSLLLRLGPVGSGATLFGHVEVEWELENVGQTSLYICQW